MAEIKILSKVEMSFNVLLKLSEEEARALDAICGYGPKLFIEWFYKTHGKHYLKPHEDGMRSLFDTVRQQIGFRLHDIEQIRKAVREGTAKLNQPVP